MSLLVTQLDILRIFLTEEMNIHSALGTIKRQVGRGGRVMLRNVPAKDPGSVQQELHTSVYFLLSSRNPRNSGGHDINYKADSGEELCGVGKAWIQNKHSL